MHEKLIARYLTFDHAGRYTGSGVAEIQVDDPHLDSADGANDTYHAATVAVLDEPALPEGSLVVVTALTRPA